MQIILDSFIVAFIALALVVGAIAAFLGYVIHKASGAGNLGFLSTELNDENRPFTGFAAESATELRSEVPLASSSSSSSSRSSQQFSPESRQEGPGAPGMPSLTRSPCQFCRRVRASLRDAWNAL